MKCSYWVINICFFFSVLGFFSIAVVLGGIGAVRDLFGPLGASPVLGGFRFDGRVIALGFPFWLTFICSIVSVVWLLKSVRREMPSKNGVFAFLLIAAAVLAIVSGYFLPLSILERIDTSRSGGAGGALYCLFFFLPLFLFAYYARQPSERRKRGNFLAKAYLAGAVAPAVSDALSIRFLNGGIIGGFGIFDGLFFTPIIFFLGALLVVFLEGCLQSQDRHRRIPA